MSTLLQACLNGGRPQGAPRSPEELARAAKEAVAAGAVALHIHPRDGHGRESLEAHAVDAAVVAIRAACPGTPLGVTTGAWIEPDPARRLEQLRTWTSRPDYASVNLCEPGAVELCAALGELGIGVEAGVWTAADVEIYLAARLDGRVVRVMLEPMEADLDAARANVAAMTAALVAAGTRARRLVHGKDATTWPILDDAIAAGEDTRMGLEDTQLLPDGRPARDNAELVAEAARRIGR